VNPGGVEGFRGTVGTNPRRIGKQIRRGYVMKGRKVRIETATHSSLWGIEGIKKRGALMEGTGQAGDHEWRDLNGTTRNPS